MRKTLDLALTDLEVDELDLGPTAEPTLESLASGHAMSELSASVLPAGCCSCSLPCCC